MHIEQVTVQNQPESDTRAEVHKIKTHTHHFSLKQHFQDIGCCVKSRQDCVAIVLHQHNRIQSWSHRQVVQFAVLQWCHLTGSHSATQGAATTKLSRAQVLPPDAGCVIKNLRGSAAFLQQRRIWCKRSICTASSSDNAAVHYCVEQTTQLDVTQWVVLWWSSKTLDHIMQPEAAKHHLKHMLCARVNSLLSYLLENIFM